MLPAPTAGLMLQLADLRERFGRDHLRCSAHLRGMARRLGNGRVHPSKLSRSDDLDDAETGALETLAGLCDICAIRAACLDPIEPPVMPLARAVGMRTQ